MSMFKGKKDLWSKRHYKRRCDKDIGGCGKTVDKDDGVVVVVRGEKHLCCQCAGELIRTALKPGD